MMRHSSFVLPTCGAWLLLSACGMLNEENGVLADSEITESQLSSTNAAITTTPPTSPVGGSHLRLAWGYLSGRRPFPNWILWSGGVTVDQGAVSLENLIYFESNDHPAPSSNAQQVDWVSQTGPHFDGVVVNVQPTSSSAVVHFGTPPFSVDVSAADLAAGVERRYVVDGDGHEVSVSSVPEASCGGFVFGYERASREGWRAFGGRWTDSHGAAQGILRFRAEANGSLQARLWEGDTSTNDRALVATGTGQLSETAIAADGESFDIALTSTAGQPFATVRGIYHAPSYSTRGSIQATWDCK